MLELLADLVGKLSFFFILHVTSAGQFPRPLGEEEEKDCLKRYRSGDEAAGERLVEHNLRLVAHIVKKYYASGADPDDLVSIGTIGLIKAIRTFDPSKGIKLSGYASRCIDNEILMYFRSIRKTAQNVSLQEQIDSDSDGNALTLMDVLSVDDTIVEDLDRKLQLEALGHYLRESLTPREQLVIRLRYGLDGSAPLTQKEVSALLKISRSYVSRIEKKALSALRARYEEGTLL